MSTNTVKSEPQAEFKGVHFLLCMMAFFGVIIAVNLTMAVLASTSWTGLVVKNTYVASQQFNGTLEQAKAQRDLGLSSDIAYQAGQLSFILRGKSGEQLNPQTVMLEIGRPAYEQSDSTYQLMPSSDASFELNLPLAQGIWQLTLHAMVDGVQYRRDARIYVQYDGIGRVE